MKRLSIALGSLLGAASFTLASPAFASAHLTADLKVPASVVAQLGAFNGCSNHGDTIDLSGTLSSAPVAANIYLANNLKGTHTSGPYDAQATVNLSDFSTTTFAKQGSLPNGVGGNPWIGLSDALTDPVTVLGRCVQGLNANASLNFLLDAHLELDVTTGNCSQSGGPTVNLSGTLTVGGASVYVFLQNKQTEPNHWASTDAQLGFAVTPNSSVSVAKSPHFGGAGGNPLVLIQIASGSVLNLGRCNQI
jgi:hypothetical protein